MFSYDRIQNFIQGASREQLIEEIDRYLALLRFNETMISSLDFNNVLDKILLQACLITQAENASILLINKEKQALEFAASTDKLAKNLKNIHIPMGSGISGYVAKMGKIVNIRDVQQDPHFYREVDLQTGEKTQSYLCVPLMIKGEIIGTAQLMNKQNGSHFTEADERFMEIFASQAALALETVMLHRDSLLKGKMESEIQLARDIQKSLLPHEEPEIEGYAISGYNMPARMVGGDYYNYMRNVVSINKEMMEDQSDNRAESILSVIDQDSYNHDDYEQLLYFENIILADISGKGIPASLIVSKLHAALYMLCQHHQKLSILTDKLNTFLFKNLITGTFVSMFIGKLEPLTGLLSYVSCGHNPAYHFRRQPDGNFDVAELGYCGAILGLELNTEYAAKHTILEPGDLLLVYSDGIIEAEDSQRQHYGEERLINLCQQLLANLTQICDTEDGIAEKVKQRILEDVNKHRNGAEINDDATLIVLYRKKMEKENVNIKRESIKDFL